MVYVIVIGPGGRQLCMRVRLRAHVRVIYACMRACVCGVTHMHAQTHAHARTHTQHIGKCARSTAGARLSPAPRRRPPPRRRAGALWCSCVVHHDCLYCPLRLPVLSTATACIVYYDCLYFPLSTRREHADARTLCVRAPCLPPITSSSAACTAVYI
jgi:hypothetical protein